MSTFRSYSYKTKPVCKHPTCLKYWRSNGVYHYHTGQYGNVCSLPIGDLGIGYIHLSSGATIPNPHQVALMSHWVSHVLIRLSGLRRKKGPIDDSLSDEMLNRGPGLINRPKDANTFLCIYARDCPQNGLVSVKCCQVELLLLRTPTEHWGSPVEI